MKWYVWREEHMLLSMGNRPFTQLHQLTLWAPNIHMQILQTDIHTVPQREIESLIKDQSNFSLVIIWLILLIISLDNMWILLGENWCWSPLGFKWWHMHQNETEALLNNLVQITTVLFLPTQTLIVVGSVVCATDESKLCISPSAKTAPKSLF